MIELTFRKELMVIKQMHQKSVIFVTIGVFQNIVLSFNQMSVSGVMIYYWSLSTLAILRFQTLKALIIAVSLV